MDLRTWRQSQTPKLKLAQAAKIFGVALGSLSQIERGIQVPGIETVCRIDGATRGAVTFADHIAAWRRAHPQQFHQFREAGRSSAKAYRPPAKTRKKRIS